MHAGAEAEEEVVQLCRQERFDEATAALLRLYGSELTGFLVAMAHDDARAADAYSLMCERLWRSLPSFRFESSLRTWTYVIARRALHDVRRAEHKGPAMVAASPSQLPEVVEQARTSTRPHQRTTYKQQLQQVRSTLSPDEQLLLVLRLDRQMAWDEIARVLSDEDQMDAASLRRESAALRKRFSRAKDRLGKVLRARRAAEDG